MYYLIMLLDGYRGISGSTEVLPVTPRSPRNGLGMPRSTSESLRGGQLRLRRVKVRPCSEVTSLHSNTRHIHYLRSPQVVTAL